MSDSKLVESGLDIEWVFKGCSPSKPLEESLKNPGMTIKNIP